MLLPAYSLDLVTSDNLHLDGLWFTSKEGGENVPYIKKNSWNLYTTGTILVIKYIYNEHFCFICHKKKSDRTFITTGYTAIFNDNYSKNIHAIR